MKKTIAVLLSVLMLFTLAACGGGDKQKDGSTVNNSNSSVDNNSADKVTEPTKLSGKKEAVEVLVGFYVDGAIDRGYDYDSNGNMILDINYMDDGLTEKEKDEWLYDESNRLLRESYTDNYSSYSTRTTDYNYDGNGRLEKSVRSDGSRIEYKTDAVGNTVEEQSFLADGTKGSRTVYEYDAAGNITLRAMYKADGTLNYEYRYEYDGSGNVKCETCTYADGTQNKTLREYNAEGELLKYERFDNGERTRDYGYEYDTKGFRTKYYDYYYGESTVDAQETVYTNDAAGNCIRADKYEDGEIEEYYIYEYDSQGRRVEFSRYDDDGEFEYGETITYTDSGLRLKRILHYPDKTRTVDYEYKTIEVPVERADWVREYQMEYDP